jgi:prevent-host-death family protein
MAVSVNMHQAKASLSRLVERALAGEDVIIARNGQALVRLVPIPAATQPEAKREPREPGRGKGTIWIGPDFEFTDEEITELFEAPLEPPE